MWEERYFKDAEINYSKKDIFFLKINSGGTG